MSKRLTRRQRRNAKSVYKKCHEWQPFDPPTWGGHSYEAYEAKRRKQFWWFFEGTALIAILSLAALAGLAWLANHYHILK